MIFTNTFTKVFPLLKSRCYCSVTAVEQLKKASVQTRNTKYRIADKKYIYVRGGTGGMGKPSVGGIGGNGGDVYIKCVAGGSLAQYSSHNRRFIAGQGSMHEGKRLKVRHGNDVYISVPAGTEVMSHDKVLIQDMNTHDDVIMIAKGGFGGSSKTIDFNGQKGESKSIYLELKTIADASLTGFPNAGKSSVLRTISRAIPKIGNYPFTTINPMVGSIVYSDKTQIKVVDLPGLIEDAHLNKGMGHKFLRHIERTKIVVLVIDINGFQLKENDPYRSPFETIILLLKELALYQDVILSRPFMILFNKMDCSGAETKYEQVINEMQLLNANHHLLNDLPYAEIISERVKEFTADNFSNVFKVSAVNETGFDGFKKSLHRVLVAET